ncbi:MAG: zf-TFIIB domain-containing protein [Ignavibacteria bacterium]|nr:zf-TFIIB domain-containing protein [Ignavibacteria bacterium]
MKCPNCNVSLLMTDRNGIEIDYCPECRGVWLDRGELDKIIERSSQNVKQSKADMYVESQRFSKDKDDRYHKDYDNRYYKDDDKRYKNKKGLLGELFDF